MNLKDINDNPLSKRWKERYSSQPEEIQMALDELYNKNSKQYQLKLIKRKRIEPSDGDIFVLSPREGIYYFGKVLVGCIKHKSNDTFIDSKSLVFIFNTPSSELTFEDYFKDYNNLLISPVIVDSSYWKQGFFYTIGKETVTDEERSIDYGFYSIGKMKFFKENGEEIENTPKLLGTYGISTITGVAYQIEQEIIINPDLLKIKKK